MTELKDIEITFDPDEIVSALYPGRKPSEKILFETRKVLEQVVKLAHPRALYVWVDVAAVRGEQIELVSRDGPGRVLLTVGPHADLMAKAEIALVSAVTIGETLDTKVRALNGEGKPLESYLLDSVGVIALAKTGDAVRAYAESEAALRKWGVSPSLAPGSLHGWSFSEQPLLCSLLLLKEIGLHLNANGVLIPFKSATGMIGLGPGYASSRVASVCQWCTRADTCWRRH